MVTVSNYEKRKGNDDKEFFLLQLQGDIEIVFSQSTGMPYATARKTKISTTFDELTCKGLVGKQLPGTITKVLVDEYEYIIPDTKEVIILDYSYVYSPAEKTMEEEVFEQPVMA
jgi:hypothetical protein